MEPVEGMRITVTANGALTFATPVAAGGSYAVTVGTQPTGEICTVSSGQGSQLGGNVSEFVHPIVEIELKRHRKV